jgi:flagellar biogenesis protein FliO
VVLLFLKYLSFLLAVLMLIYLCFNFVQKQQGRKKKPKIIEIIEHKQIDQKHAISLVSIDKIRLVLITGPNSISVQQIVHEEPKSFGSKLNHEIH